MNLALLRRAFRESSLLLFGCMITIFGFCLIRVYIVGQVDMSRFQGILEILKPEFERFSPLEFEQVMTYPGRVSITYTEPLMIVWAITRGSTAVSGPLAQGNLEMMLAQPISRYQWLGANAIVTVFGTFLIGMSAWLGVYAGLHTTTVKIEQEPLKINVPVIGIELPLPFTTDQKSPERVPITDFVDENIYLPSSMNLIGLGLFFAGLTTLMSAWDRYRWRTIGIVSAIMLIQMILRVMSLSIEGQQWLANFTILTWYEPEVLSALANTYQDSWWQYQLKNPRGDILYGGLAYFIWPVFGSLICYALALVIFVKRDLPAPI